MTPTKLHTILRNRYYLGVVNWKGVEYPGRHPALITPEIFDVVQKLLQLRRTASDRTQKYDHYLSGTVRCGRCNGRLLFGYGKSKTGDQYAYFYCAERKMGGPCRLPYLPAATVERKVERLWATEVIAPEVIRELEARLGDDLQTQNAETIKQVAQLSNRIEDLKRERYRWAEKAMEGAVPPPTSRARSRRNSPTSWTLARSPSRR